MTHGRAKVFWTGRSQAVRLPKEFRFEGEEVAVRRVGKAVILEPVSEWPDGWVESFTSPDVKLSRPPQGIQERRKPIK
jgi:virulence-associated protein VagC